MFSTGVDLDQVADLSIQFTQDRTIWTDPPVGAAQRILAELKRPPSMSGGPDQIVCLDRAGAHWISPPPKAVIPFAENLLSATITATVQLNSPIINGGSLNITTSGGTISISPGSSGVSCAYGGYLSYFGVGVCWVQGSGGYSAVNPNGLIVNTSAASTSISVTGMTATGGGNTVYVQTTGLMISNGTSASALSATGFSMSGLPSSSPGAGTKKFWYDPADGNRVKFAP